MTEAKEYLRPAQVGEIIGWTLSTLANYRCSGDGPPYVKVRNRVLYPADDLDRWIADQADKSENKEARRRPGLKETTATNLNGPQPPSRER